LDQLLEEVRHTSNSDKKLSLLKEIQEILVTDKPALFLYAPSFLYVMDRGIKNVTTIIINDQDERFVGVEHWYKKTKPAWGNSSM
jgi:ABC-type transport system substrate-binding protein